MKLPASKFAVLAVFSFAASITVILSNSPPESDEPVQLLSSEAERQTLEVVLLRTTAKCRIARDMIAGRLSLVEAAALFGALNRVPPRWQSGSWTFRFLADTDEELLCRQVIQYVGRELDEEPDRRESTMARFKADFKEELCKEEAIRLPNLLTLVPVEKLLAQARVELTDQGVLPLRGGRSEEAASGY